MPISIPKGRKVQIFSGETDLFPSTPLVLEEDLTISLSSNFAPLIDSGGSDALTILGQLSSEYLGFGFSGQFKQAGFQVWKGTDPMQTSFTIGLYMRTDAYRDVMVPAKTLMKIPLPVEASDAGGGVGLIAPGPSILEVFSENPTTRTQNQFKNISVSIGKTLYMKRVAVKKAEPTFSPETDENDFPIWCKIQLDVISIYTATTSMVDAYMGVGR